MKFKLWINGSAQGPYDLTEVRRMLAKGEISPETLHVVDGSDGEWSPVGVLDSRPPAAAAATIPAASLIDAVKSESRWEGFLNVMGLIIILLGSIGILSGLISLITGEGSVSGFFYGVCGIIVGIQCLLAAFLVDVFTDIRWYLKQLFEQKQREPAAK